MKPTLTRNYLAGYPTSLVQEVSALMDKGLITELLHKKYSNTHEVRNDKALYDYVTDLKKSYLCNEGQLKKVAFDNTLSITRNALGVHTSKSRLQGAKLKTIREIHVATMFKDMPADFLRMIVVHELSHMKVAEHNKAFYKLCCYMEPNYHQLEFDVRVYLTYLETTNIPIWTHEMRGLP